MKNKLFKIKWTNIYPKLAVAATGVAFNAAMVIGIPQMAQGVQIYSQSLEPGQYSAYDVQGPYTGLMTEQGFSIGSWDDETVFGRSDHIAADFLWFTSGWMDWNYTINIPTHTQISSVSYTTEISSEYPGFNWNWPSDLTVSLNGVDIDTWTIPGDPGGELGHQENTWSGISAFGWLTTWTVDTTGTYLEYKFRQGDQAREKVSDVTINDLGILPGQDLSVRLSVPYTSDGFGLNIYGDTWGDYDYDPTVTVRYDTTHATAPEPSSVLGLFAFGILCGGAVSKRRQK